MARLPRIAKPERVVPQRRRRGGALSHGRPRRDTRSTLFAPETPVGPESVAEVSRKRQPSRSHRLAGDPSAPRDGSSHQAGCSYQSPFYFDSPTALGSWLETYHASRTELFVGYFKKHTGRQTMTWSQAVDEALCWGWIDGQVKSVDGDRTAQRFTPRRPISHWSRINVEKVAVLEASGRMRDPGRRAFALRTEANTAQASHEREAVALSDEFVARLDAVPEAAGFFAACPPGYRRQVSNWVMGAKRAETREKRLAELIAASAKAHKVRQFAR